ncbi:DUF938 domain-containing protein [Psychrobacter lutiphocae]|uniref:DUF938 domain-containing protein n=1 Tax=Psychrobacter lutiphocae TaxID=540500 RepID=UPI00036A95A5|nr:DUF938 domain-containing protein [Psychrobacter lutiphocae]
MSQQNLSNTDADFSEDLPFSQACENNKQPILKVLQQELSGCHSVLEVGSGTGQHSVYFAPRLPHLQWQTSDVIANHRVIEAWHDRHPAANLHKPLVFDLNSDNLPIIKTDSQGSYDAVFTANTLHIINWSLVERLFQLVAEALPVNGKLIVYGPFNDKGQYSSDSNRQFDLYLRRRDANSGIRDKVDLITLAKQNHMSLNTQYQMPANNEILVFKKCDEV